MLGIKLFSIDLKLKSLFRLLFGAVLLESVLCEYRLKVTNDGPTLLDTSITFFAELEGFRHDEEYTYIFEGPFGAKASVKGKENASFTHVYKSYDFGESEGVPTGNYQMKIKAQKIFLFIPEEIARAHSKFVLTETINGNFTTNAEFDIVPVNTTLNVTYNIHDPTGFFQHADMDYAWSINELKFYGFDNTVNYNVTKEGTISIDVVVHARIPAGNTTENMNKWGFLKKEIVALRPVSNINVAGNVYLKQGEILYLDISCEGSEPFSYCPMIIPGDSSAANITCDPVFFSQCSFHYQYYFPSAGTYAIGALIGNRLGAKQYPIKIEIYDVSKKAQLSTVIVPIACSLLAMVIVVGGIAYHVQQRKAYVIEVADFDFQQPMPLNEKTFVERLKESYKVAYANCNEKKPEDDAEDTKQSLYDPDGSTAGGGGGSRSLLLPRNYGYGAIA